jgi:hypothetical protein
MTYDSHRNEVVLFGGMDSTGPRNDTWLWNGKAWRHSDAPGPSPRTDVFLAFDSFRGVAVMFGGFGKTSPPSLGDTWEWNGERWLEGGVPGGTPDPRAQVPPARNSHAMASAGPSGGVLLVGGALSSAPRLIDTLWLWNGSSWQAQSDAGPPGLALPAAVYDTRRNVLVVYGGAGLGNGTLYGNTWEWDGNIWEQRNVRTPGPRDHHAMAFDEARGQTVVFGGSKAGTFPNETWTWDGATWSLADTVTGPGGLVHHAMAYDSRRQRVVLFGGFAPGRPPAGETWEWDGQRWSRIATDGPGARTHLRMAYDPVRQVTVLFGGGIGTGSSSTSPQDTWTWDGTRWERRAIDGPPPRWGHAMAYDTRRQRVILFGGSRAVRPFGNLDDIWEWDGDRWLQVTPQ